MNDFFRLHNTKGVQLFLPINSVRKVDDNPYNLDEGSCVQFRYNDRPCYGVLIWIGVLPQTNDVTVAGVEMVSTLV